MPGTDIQIVSLHDPLKHRRGNSASCEMQLTPHVRDSIRAIAKRHRALDARTHALEDGLHLAPDMVSAEDLIKWNLRSKSQNLDSYHHTHRVKINKNTIVELDGS